MVWLSESLRMRVEMIPGPGARNLRFVGDSIEFRLRVPEDESMPPLAQARLRTNIGRGRARDLEIIAAHRERREITDRAWHDIPMERSGAEWVLTLSVNEPGFFEAKPYLLLESGRMIWPEGGNCGVSVHPDHCRTANTIYCAFTRLFGETRFERKVIDFDHEKKLLELDERGYSVIPPSGKLRDLARQLPHIVERLGCRVLHLLPVNPTPTTFARMGRFGSPYAALDLTGIDPALVEFDKRSNGVDQFRELTAEAHRLDARVFIDIVINHTGWGSNLWEDHPDWFLRKEDGEFVSPGAWGTTWEDLVELHHDSGAPWDYLADMFLTWCRRGVDGFRCDAGYKVPMPVWRYITSRVRLEFPNTVFLLEGLGGPWEATENLLTFGGMQWAYSELFQNYSAADISNYLDYSIKQSDSVGYYVHYSETHDNNRLAAEGRDWSLLRNRVCGLTSPGGGFGFTCGVEWLADEKILVHHCTGLGWDGADNIVDDLAKLNRLLSDHPCFLDGAKLANLTPSGSPVFLMRRESADGESVCLVVVNPDREKAHPVKIPGDAAAALSDGCVDLLGQDCSGIIAAQGGDLSLTVPKAGVFCLAESKNGSEVDGETYRRERAVAAWIFDCLSVRFGEATFGPADYRKLSAMAQRDPAAVLAAFESVSKETFQGPFVEALRGAATNPGYRNVVLWIHDDARRILTIPDGHWCLFISGDRFRVSVFRKDGEGAVHRESVETAAGFVAAVHSGECDAGDWIVRFEHYNDRVEIIKSTLRFLNPAPTFGGRFAREVFEDVDPIEAPLVLLTNGRGAMTRMCVDLGSVKSKYDCVLGANLHPTLPVDRHVMIKRLRIWANADGFISQLDAGNLVEFVPGPPASWRFIANAGGGRNVLIDLTVDLLDMNNTVVLELRCSDAGDSDDSEHRRREREDFGKSSDEMPVFAVLRFDIEDRNFHWETKRNDDADAHFARSCKALKSTSGFEFAPDSERTLRVEAGSGRYFHEGEWSENLPHPVEASRGQEGCGDGFSPGWFELPLSVGTSATVVASMEPVPVSPGVAKTFRRSREDHNEEAVRRAGIQLGDSFGRQLAIATQSYVVRRENGKTVIAGYPWFLDWGRDSLICARGLLAAGLTDEVGELLGVFGRYEEDGTLPNTIHGSDLSNRNTSDAPLWYAVVCEEFAELGGEKKLHAKLPGSNRTFADVVRSIAIGYLEGTSNGIRVDPESNLVWSPSHFTWMDTNFPAGTPREGYPVELQVLWIRLLRFLDRIGAKAHRNSWAGLATTAEKSFQSAFWIESKGWFADLLIAKKETPASSATVGDALRSNCLLASALGIVGGVRAQRMVEAARRYLVIPGAIRSLAPLPVDTPLPVRGNDGHVLNDPSNPYWGRYEGDEDSRRKPAYHNGTAWTWPFPVFCEALVRAWDFDARAVSAARGYLGSMEALMNRGCLGQIPEVLDGDAPHLQRGCDAQAWGVTEALRVWKLVNPAGEE